MNKYRINTIKLKINSMVSKLLTFITGRLSSWIIIESTHGLKQAIKQPSKMTILLLVY